MTSSPGLIARSPSSGEVSALNATRFADEPELTVSACVTPTYAARRRSNSALKRPVVSHPSSAASTMCINSGAPITLPDGGIGVVPGTKARLRLRVRETFDEREDVRAQRRVAVRRGRQSLGADRDDRAHAVTRARSVRVAYASICRSMTARSDAPSSTCRYASAVAAIASSVEKRGAQPRRVRAFVLSSCERTCLVEGRVLGDVPACAVGRATARTPPRPASRSTTRRRRGRSSMARRSRSACDGAHARARDSPRADRARAARAASSAARAAGPTTGRRPSARGRGRDGPRTSRRHRSRCLRARSRHRRRRARRTSDATRPRRSRRRPCCCCRDRVRRAHRSLERMQRRIPTCAPSCS